MNSVVLDIINSTNVLNSLNLNALTFSEALALDTAIERLSMVWDIRKIRAKAEQLINTDFIKLFTLQKETYQDLIPLKARVKNKKGIYILSFSNGKCYVGQTNNMARRLDEYFDINRREYKGHNSEIRELFTIDPELTTEIYFLEAESDLNLLESSYIEKLKANDPIYGYNKTGGNQ
jgi:predicted GIY-YIG superfamily endonuclease